MKLNFISIANHNLKISYFVLQTIRNFTIALISFSEMFHINLPIREVEFSDINVIEA